MRKIAGLAEILNLRRGIADMTISYKYLRSAIGQMRTEILHGICRPRPILFDHLPKCAGTTVHRYLLKQYPNRVTFWVDPRNVKQSTEAFRCMSEQARSRFRLVGGHNANRLSDCVHEDAVRLTILREPVDRIVSHYCFVIRDTKNYLRDRVVRNNISLENSVRLDLSSELRNWYTIHFTALSIKEVESDPTTAVQRAAEIVLRRYDVIGFQDDLPAAMRALREVARLYRKFENVVANEGERRAGGVSDEARRVIAEANWLDVQPYALMRKRLEVAAVPEEGSNNREVGGLRGEHRSAGTG